MRPKDFELQTGFNFYYKFRVKIHETSHAKLMFERQTLKAWERFKAFDIPAGCISSFSFTCNEPARGKRQYRMSAALTSLVNPAKAGSCIKASRGEKVTCRNRLVLVEYISILSLSLIEGLLKEECVCMCFDVNYV